MFSIQNFQSNLTTEKFRDSVVFYEEIRSTNNEAKRLAKEGKQEGLLVFAEKQNEISLSPLLKWPNDVLINGKKIAAF